MLFGEKGNCIILKLKICHLNRISTISRNFCTKELKNGNLVFGTKTEHQEMTLNYSR